MLSIALPGQLRGTSLMLALKRSTTTFALDGHKKKEERYQLTALLQGKPAALVGAAC